MWKMLETKTTTKNTLGNTETIIPHSMQSIFKFKIKIKEEGGGGGGRGKQNIISHWLKSHSTEICL